MLPPPLATCTEEGLSSTNQAFTNVHTHTHEHVLHTALCGGGGGGIYAVSFPDSTVGMVWE